MVTDVPLDEVSGKGTVVTVCGLPVERPVPNTLISIPGAKDCVNDALFPTDVTATPVGVLEALMAAFQIALLPGSVNHNAPSGPLVIPEGWLLAPGTAYSVIAPAVVLRPM